MGSPILICLKSKRTHLLSRHALSAAGWLGSVQPLCRGMRRCFGLVLGIIGRSTSARSLASRSLAFKINVLYFDVHGVFFFFFFFFKFPIIHFSFSL